MKSIKQIVSVVSAVLALVAFGGELDDGAFIHLDVSSSEMDVVISNGISYVSTWYDVREGAAHAAYALAPQTIVSDNVPHQISYSPRLKASEELGGHLILSTGDMSGDKIDADDSGGFFFDGMCNVRAGFIVCRPTRETDLAFYIGCSEGDNYNFHRGIGGTILIAEYAAANVKAGDWRVDGEKVEPTTYAPGIDAFHLISFTIDSSSPVNTLALDRTCRVGGMEYAEVILFDEPISDERRAAIDEALIAKWLGDEVAAPNNGNIRRLSFATGEPPEIVTPVDTTYGLINATGMLVKSGAGKATIRDLSVIDGLEVDEGAISIEMSAETILDSADFHIDASVTSSLTKNDDGLVTRIDDVRKNGHYAAVTPGRWAADGARLIASGTMGLNTIDLGEFSDQAGMATNEHTCGFNWDREITDIHTIFVVFERTGTSAQFFISSDSDSDSKWQLHGTRDLICHDYMDNNPIARDFRHQAAWNLDGFEVEDPCDAAKGGRCPNDELHVLTIRLPANYSGTYADAFGIERRYNFGGIRYGEVAVFQRSLDDTEVALVRRHLIRKWNAPSEESVSAYVEKVMEKAFFHIDPSDASTLTIDEASGQVMAIADVRKNGKIASKSVYSKCGAAVEKMGADETCRVLDFGPVYTPPQGTAGFGNISDDACSFTWSNRGEALHTLYIVLCRPAGSAQFILGCDGSDGTGYFPLHSTFDVFLHSVCENASHYNGNGYGKTILNADWTMDGVRVNDPTTDKLPCDELHVISIKIPAGGLGLIADSFAQDRICTIGGMKYGEVIVFDESLEVREDDAVRRYLCAKWLGKDVLINRDYENVPARTMRTISVAADSSVGYAGDLALDDGATLTFGYPFDAKGPLVVDGALSIGANATIDLGLVQGAHPKGGLYPLVTATQLLADENVPTWTIGGALTEACRYEFLTTDTGLSLRIIPKGLVFIIR